MLSLRHAVPAAPPPRYFIDPTYGATGTCGGTSMEVYLGPAAALPENYGSGTSNESIPALMRPLHDKDPGCWVAGHLLNDNLGGSGTKTRNLTPLTKTANRNHASYEGKIKDACTRAYSHHLYNKGDGYWYGIYYKVVVSSETFGDFSPYKKAPSHITITAKAIRKPKAGGGIQYLRDRTAGPLLFDDFADKQIDNDDAHLGV